MSAPTDLRSQLIRDEGLRLRPYRDTEGKLTIGVGRNLDDRGVSFAEAELMLDNDIRLAQATVVARIPFAASLSEIRRSVLVNMAFNMGIGEPGKSGLLGFKKFLAAVEREEWEEAAKQMLDSKWRRQVGIRAERLAEQMRTGTWQ